MNAVALTTALAVICIVGYLLRDQLRQWHMRNATTLQWAPTVSQRMMARLLEAFFLSRNWAVARWDSETIPLCVTNGTFEALIYCIESGKRFGVSSIKDASEIKRDFARLPMIFVAREPLPKSYVSLAADSNVFFIFYRDLGQFCARKFENRDQLRDFFVRADHVEGPERQNMKIRLQPSLWETA